MFRTNALLSFGRNYHIFAVSLDVFRTSLFALVAVLFVLQPVSMPLQITTSTHVGFVNETPLDKD